MSLDHPHDTESATATAIPRYWLSLEQYENPGQTTGEFASTPVREGFESEGLDRRDFLKIMGASAAMASLAGCTRRPVQKIVAYVNNPEEIIPGVPNFYASADPETGYGLLLKTREGRPIKVDGNSDHPVNNGVISARGQASVHDLYDPDRLKAPKINSSDSDWAAFDDAVKKALSASGKDGTTLLTATIMSPTLNAAIDRLGINHVMVDPISMDDVLDSQGESYGQRVFPRYRLDRADLVVSIDCDFLDTWGSTVEYSNGFTKKRKLEGDKPELNRLIAFESMMRLTGQNADLRFAIRPQDQLDIALALAAEVSRQLGKSAPDLAPFSAVAVAAKTGIKAEALVSVAQELVKHKGRSLVLGGGNVGKNANSTALHNVVNYLNSALGNEGETVDGTLSPSNQFQGSYSALKALIGRMSSGAVKTLIIQGLNPAYQFPSALGFKEALAKVPNVVYATRYQDETAELAKLVAAESHAFESWGDVSAQKDLYSIVQPTIRPLWQTRSLLEMLLAWAPGLGVKLDGDTAYDLVMNRWKTFGSGLKFWEDSLQLGVHDAMGSRRLASASARNFKEGALKSAVAAAQTKKSDSDLTLVLFTSVAMGDGSQANNALLQELPDPVSKNTWGNYLAMSPATATKLNLKDGDVVDVSAGSAKARLAIYRQPGLREGVVTAALGYGRKFAGRVGNGVGANFTDFAGVTEGVTISKTGDFDKIPCTQGHHTLEGRDIVFETTLEEFKENGKSGIVRHFPDPASIWSKFEYSGYKWGMVVDLSSCTGCSACVVACSVENNVPSVGKDQVQRGREMQWIRIDRYYTGDVDSPETIYQPMLCQHCDNAPCETVCPVLATTHSSEGLNQMTYNRCVGTKYCSNNCPYKVRRFNWYENNAGMNKPMEHPLPLSKNPEVTLRSRGVMEKCTFCVQRIEAGKSAAKSQGRRVEDKDIKTACQEACPADCITFGDMNNPESRVAKLMKSPRGFTTLEELNTRPAITYLTKVRNREALKGAERGHEEHHA